MADTNKQVLAQEVAYSGEGISVKLLEETIHSERTALNGQVDELARMRSRNAEIQKSLAEEMDKLRQLSEELSRTRRGKKKGFLGGLFAKLRGGEPISHRSIEELLRGQYEISSVRLKQASEFADRLEASKEELYDEIDRLNRKIIESAENEETAAAYVEDLQTLKAGIEANLRHSDPSSADERQLQSELDKVRRRLADHTTRLKLYSTAEERLAKLRNNSRQLAETISHLQSDITRYVVAASEKLDLISGQIQAIGAAADASVVMLELKQSLDAMTESINHTTRFVAETQAYFRENVDSMIDELKIYDEETERVLDENLVYSDSYDELNVEQALAAAFERKLAEAQAKEDPS
jgi:ABC-type transporter Mla subunit MlaD